MQSSVEGSISPIETGPSPLVASVECCVCMACNVVAFALQLKVLQGPGELWGGVMLCGECVCVCVGG
jgi:hypothetical protein